MKKNKNNFGYVIVFGIFALIILKCFSAFEGDKNLIKQEPLTNDTITFSKTLKGDTLDNSTQSKASSTKKSKKKTIKKKKKSIKSNSSQTTSGYRTYYRGPRGGCYYYSSSGKKVYVDRSLCN